MPGIRSIPRRWTATLLALVFTGCWGDEPGTYRSESHYAGDAGVVVEVEQRESAGGDPSDPFGKWSVSLADAAAETRQYTCGADEPRDPGGVREAGEPCCQGRGVCTPGSRLDAGQLRRLGHESCRDDLVCAPSPSSPEDSRDVGTTGVVCDVLGDSGVEGRCVPACFLIGDAFAPHLSRSSCGSGEVCAPCYDMLAGAPTGVCAGEGDAPRHPPHAPFPRCAGGEGYCVREAFWRAASDASIERASCADGELCAPALKVEDPFACLARCSAVVGPGACWPAALVPDAQRRLAVQGSCSSNEICLPCVDLFDDGAPTGACQ